MGNVAGLARLLVVLAVALQSFGVLRDIHASHTHAPEAVHTADAACDASHPHSHATHEGPASPGEPTPDEECPTCDLLAVLLKGWTSKPPAQHEPDSRPVAFLAETHHDAPLTRRWSPSRSRDPPTNTNRAV